MYFILSLHPTALFNAFQLGPPAAVNTINLKIAQLTQNKRWEMSV
jgi:hypothetical protein